MDLMNVEKLFSSMVDSLIAGRDKVPASAFDGSGAFYRDGKPSDGRSRSDPSKPTKMDLAMEIVQTTPDRNEAIEAIRIECELQENSAVTYYYNAKKKLAGL